MKEIVVISGKGGTGKTSLVAAFAALAGQAVLADCDVDAADLHLILTPDVRQAKDFSGGKLARVMADTCIGCGRCREVCHFEAAKFNGPANEVVAKTYTIDPNACEGCSVCVEFCPVDAIEFYDAVNGQWFISQTRFGTLVHARLTPGEENSGKLVSLIRKEAKRLADEQGNDLLIVDGSPGIGCPVIASITGADVVLIVTEPTVSGQHDLERVTALTAHFGIPTAVCVNKYDINLEITQRIATVAEANNIPLLGQIPYDPVVTRAQMVGQSVVEYGNGSLKGQVQSLWQAVLDRARSMEKKED